MLGVYVSGSGEVRPLTVVPTRSADIVIHGSIPGETFDDLSPIEKWLCHPTQYTWAGGTYAPEAARDAVAQRPSGTHLWPSPRPRVTYTLPPKYEYDDPEVCTDPVLVVVTEGVYVGDQISQARFLLWDEIESSTIPLSDLRVGHPPD